MKQQITIPVFIPHFGCPHTCVFCNQVHATNKSNLPDADSIFQQVADYTRSKKPSVNNVELAFFGGSFTALDVEIQKKFLKISNSLMQQNKIDSIRLSTRPDFITDETIELLLKYKVKTVEIGAQSFDNYVLQKSNRGHTAEDIVNAITLLQEAKFDTVIQLMPGLVAASNQSDLSSCRQAIKLNPAAVRIYPTVVIKNTQLESLYSNRQFTPLSLQQAIELCAIMYINCLNNRIKVIKMGIHPFADDTIQNIIAGPYHPAFGFLVKSHLKKLLLQNFINFSIKPEKPIKHIMLTLPLKDIEEYIGSKKENINFLKQLYNCNSISYKAGKELYIAVNQ